MTKKKSLQKILEAFLMSQPIFYNIVDIVIPEEHTYYILSLQSYFEILDTIYS